MSRLLQYAIACHVHTQQTGICPARPGSLLCSIPVERSRQLALRAGYEPRGHFLPPALPPVPGTDGLHHHGLVHAMARCGAAGSQPAVPGANGPGRTVGHQGVPGTDVCGHSCQRHRGRRALLC